MARKSKELAYILEIFKEDEFIDEEKIELMDIDAKFIYNLKENASYIVDEREIGYVLHSVESIILSVIFAIIANCNTFVQIYLFMQKHFEWLDKHIKFDNGLPSLSTVKRVIAFINPKELENICLDSLQEFLKNNEPLYRNKYFVIEDIKSIDGKTANSSDRISSKKGKVAKTNAMSLYSIKNDCCEATEFIEEKTNEIPTGPKLLKSVNIKDCIIVFDALSTQKQTIEYIIENKGHYVAPVKGNQGSLKENIKLYFEDKKLFNDAKEKCYYSLEEKSHGTVEKREYIFTDDIEWLYKKNEWEGLKSIGVAIRTYQDKNGKTITDKRYFITNLHFERIELISKAIRGEWGIENKLHWYLDTVFLEDDNKCFLENSQKNLNIIRKFCLNILKIFKLQTKLSMNSIRFNISMDFEHEIEKIINILYK